MIEWADDSVRVWEAAAKHWDDHPDWWSRGPRAEMFDFFCQFAGAGPLSALDIGCGPGVSTRMMLDYGYDAVGLDQSEKMVEAALGRGVKALVSRCDPIPFADASFDAAFACTSLEWTPAPSRIVGEIYRVLKPGGAFVAITLGPSAGPREMGYRRLYGEPVIHNMMMPWELRRLCEEHGFSCESMRGAHRRAPDSVIEALQGDWLALSSLHFLWGFAFRKQDAGV